MRNPKTPATSSGITPVLDQISGDAVKFPSGRSQDLPPDPSENPRPHSEVAKLREGLASVDMFPSCAEKVLFGRTGLKKLPCGGRGTRPFVQQWMIQQYESEIGVAQGEQALCSHQTHVSILRPMGALAAGNSPWLSRCSRSSSRSARQIRTGKRAAQRFRFGAFEPRPTRNRSGAMSAENSKGQSLAEAIGEHRIYCHADSPPRHGPLLLSAAQALGPDCWQQPRLGDTVAPHMARGLEGNPMRKAARGLESRSFCAARGGRTARAR